MKIAIPTEDGTHIGDHFGRSPSFLVFSIEEGQIREKSLRQNTHAEGEHGHEGASGHSDILAALAGCQVVIAHGMGPRAVRDLEASGLEVRLTSTDDAEEAIQLYLQGQLPSATGSCQPRCA
ncbi:MAG: NifB/NifX family molybdenum-iron cluster-binding protein [Coprothermobacterota bacterium]|nr:NifB/NifX family molybdenum-iron cluster-binding protein [Coprothermobacterota bacterium]